MRSYLSLAAIVGLTLCGCGLQPPSNEEADNQPVEATNLKTGGVKGGIVDTPDDHFELPVPDDAGPKIGADLSPNTALAPDCTIISPIGLSGVVPGTYGTTTAVLFIDLYETGFDEPDAEVVWMFGDGALVPGDVAESHLYPGDGIYDVTVTVQGESREVTFDAVLTIEGQVALLAEEECPNTVFCDLLDCSNGELVDPCLDDDSIRACP